MLTRREEDIVILEIEEKNTELFFKWAEGKEGNRYGEDGRQEGTAPTEGSGTVYPPTTAEEANQATNQ